MRNVLFYIALCAGVSCNIDTHDTSFSPIYSFTDEIVSLRKLNPFVDKTITKGGISKKLNGQVDWRKELRYFVEAEINNPKLQSEYVIETTKSGSKTIINCSSQSEHIKTKQIQYVFNGEKCEMIYMQRLVLDRINNNYQELYYQPGLRYEINGTQKMREINDFTYKVVGEIINDTKEYWAFDLKLNGEVLPFNITKEGERYTITNGKEQIQIESTRADGDTIILDLPVFNSELRFARKDNVIKGRWYNLAKGNYSIPFDGRKSPETRFQVTEAPSKDFSGKWEVTYSPETEDEYPAIGVFEQNGNKVTGTFMTETGDYRFLEGNIDGNKMLLSCFDGAHAFLFKATIDDNEVMVGTFFSGKHWEEPWTAKRNENAALADPHKLTHQIDSTKPFVFSFPNLDSVLISNRDDRYVDKVVLVQIMASWCPNCMDETKFLAELYPKFNPEGLEIISICFEASNDFEKSKTGVEKLKRHFGTKHEYLLAGCASKKCAANKLPQLNHIMSFPTTLFIDKRGKIRKIHTGFYGPVTGPYYKMYVEQTTAFIEQLLAEK
jgi:thiol-disulfide isomerase/thioredoxin